MGLMVVRRGPEPSSYRPPNREAAGFIGDAQSVEDFLGCRHGLRGRHRHVFWVNVVRSKRGEFTHATETVQAFKAFRVTCEGLGKNADMRKT